VPDRFTKLYDKEFARLFADNGVEPDHDEVLAGLGTKITREARRALEAYGIRQDIGSKALAELFVDEDDHLLDSLARKLLSEQISAVFDTLTEREAGIIAMRFGFEMDLGEVSEARGWMSEDSFDKWVEGQVLADKPWTHRQIGAVYGVTLERIRQIESKTMSKLRHPSRAEVLESYADVSEKLSPYARAKADKRYANAEMFARLKEARETGLENLMEDDSLTFTDSATLMTLSHDELKAARVYNHKATRHMCRLFGLRRQPQGEGIDYEIKFRKDALNQQMIGRQLVSSNVELEPEIRSQYWQEMQFYYHALQVLKRFETEIDRNSSVRSFITS
jgi:RNA polymerase sigma factor (sigma-70 family)